MANYLVAISIGPVQSLIEAGRRAQDLWCGSWLLSEVARAVALKLHKIQEDCLIFPNPANPDIELQPQSENDTPEANIANVIRVILSAESETQLEEQIIKAKGAALARLKDIFKNVFNKKKLKNIEIDHDRWLRQQEDMLEIFSAWVLFDKDSYQKASKRLGQLLQARKLTRNFLPMQDNAEALPKSTLDGANNTVIPKLANWNKRLLSLTNEEELDALGVVKRLAGNVEQFTPFSRIVAHSWLESLRIEQPQEFEALKATYEKLLKSNHVTKVEGNDQLYNDFPFDGEYLFLSRLQQADIEPDLKNELQNQLKAIKSSPVPYGVLLKADGDRMGDLLAKAEETKDSKKISKALHDFASSVRKTLQNHGGHAIYAGGDDVLAFLPLSNAMKCAEQLANDFKGKMQNIAQDLGLEEASYPTLSVGLAIGHFVQPMRQLRQRAISAEKHAKGNKEKLSRNALAIHLGIRSGHEITWRCRWDDEETLKALNDFTDAFAKGWMPTRIMQEVREMAHLLKWTKGQDELAVGIRKSELERMLSRADFAVNIEDSNKTAEEIAELKCKEVNKLKSQLRTQASRNSLDELANLLILARWLSAKTITDIGGAE